jgi:hypothetical protein
VSSRPSKTDPEALIAALAEDARRRAAEAGAGPHRQPGAAEPDDDELDAAEPGAGAARWPEPDPEQLLEYLEGRLPAEEAARLERRLVADPAAARALADLADLAGAAPPAAEAPADLTVRAGWRDFEKRLDGARRRRGGRSPWLPALAAAASLAATLLGYRVVALQQMLSQPVGIAATLTLGETRSAAEEETLELAPGEAAQLAIETERRCDAYRVEIEGPGAGDRQAVEEGLGWTAPGLVRVLWRAELGEYRLVLSGSGCEGGEPVRREHVFRVVRPQPAGGEGGGG